MHGRIEQTNQQQTKPRQLIRSVRGSSGIVTIGDGDAAVTISFSLSKSRDGRTVIRVKNPPKSGVAIKSN